MSDYFLSHTEWKTNSNYPKELKDVYRFNQIHNHPKGILTGTLFLDPLCEYPPHFHQVSEMYYVIQGEARWTVNHETKIVKTGDWIYHPEYAKHSWTNLQESPLHLLWIRWQESHDMEIEEKAKLCG